MALDPLIINRDDSPKRTRCSLSHGGSLLAVLVAFSHLQFSQIRGRQPYLFVRKISYVIAGDSRRCTDALWATATASSGEALADLSPACRRLDRSRPRHRSRPKKSRRSGEFVLISYDSISRFSRR